MHVQYPLTEVKRTGLELDRAALVAGVDLETIDFALLVGMLARLQSWHQNEAGLLEKGKRSLCSDIRQQGVELLEQFAQTCPLKEPK